MISVRSACSYGVNGTAAVMVLLFTQAQAVSFIGC